MYKKEITIILRSKNFSRLQEVAYELYLAKIPNNDPDDLENYVNKSISNRNLEEDDEK